MHTLCQKVCPQIIASYNKGRLFDHKGPIEKSLRAGTKRVDYTPGWVATAGWIENDGSHVSSFHATYTVPPLPVSGTGQILYVFAGLNGVGADDSIIQPVLSYGVDGPRGGDY